MKDLIDFLLDLSPFFLSFFFFLIWQSFPFCLSSNTLDFRQMRQVNTRRRLHYESLATEGFHYHPRISRKLLGTFCWIISFQPGRFSFLLLSFFFPSTYSPQTTFLFGGKRRGRKGSWNTWKTIVAMGWERVENLKRWNMANLDEDLDLLFQLF